jgi:hypothetical protein
VRMDDPFLAHHIPTVGRRLSSSLVRAAVSALPTATATHAATSLANSTSLSSKPCGRKITGSRVGAAIESAACQPQP